MVKKKLTKFLACLLTSFTLLMTSGITAYATPFIQKRVDSAELQQAVEVKLGNFNTAQPSTFTGEEGLLYNLNIIVEKLLWCDYLQQVSTSNNPYGYTLPSSLLNQERQNLIKEVDQFNTDYGNAKTLPLSITLTSTKGVIDAGTVINNIGSYLKQVVNPILAEVKDGDYNKVAQDNSGVLNLIYNIVENANNTVSTINGCVANSTNYKYQNTNVAFSPDIGNLQSITSQGTMAQLLAATKRNSVMNISNLKLKALGKNENLLDAFYTDKSKGVLNPVYYMIVAASSIYVPFSSHIGDNSFLTGLKAALGNNTDNSTINEDYSQMSMYYKPLYMEQTNSDGSSTSVAKRATLKSLYQSVEGDDSGALVMAKGDLKVGKDSNAYMYYKKFDSTSSSSSSSTSTSSKSSSTSRSSSSNEVAVQPNSETISSPDQLTKQVCSWGLNDNGIFSKMVLQNIFNDVSNLDTFEARNGGYLFMNPFGNIVLGDGTVVLPAAANPEIVNPGKDYFPYTNAFMMSYPSVNINSLNFTTQSPRANGKYVVIYNPNGNMDSSSNNKVGTVIDGKTIKGKPSSDFEIYQIVGNNQLGMDGFREPEISIDTSLTGYNLGVESLLQFVTYNFNANMSGSHFGITNWIHSDHGDSLTISGDTVMTPTLTQTIEKGAGTVLYGTDPKNLYPSELGIMVRTYYQYLMGNSKGTLGSTPSDNINNSLFASTILPQAFGGLTNPQAFTNDIIKNPNQWMENQLGRFSYFVTSGVNNLITSIGNITGVVGIQSAYQNPILGKTVVFFGKYALVISFVLAIIILFRFIRLRLDVIDIFLLGILSVGFIYTYLTVLPVFLPRVINYTSTFATRELSYHSIMMSSNNYKETINSGVKFSSKYTNMPESSIDLYQLQSNFADIFADRLDIPRDNLYNGSINVINPQGGTFLQGNFIKENLSSLFSNTQVVGKYNKTATDGVCYTDTALKMAPSSMDYYTPYYLMVNGFVNKLNQFSSIYKLQRKVLYYGNMTKDSFLVSDYIHSAVFLDPGKYSASLQGVEPANVIDALQKTFGTNTDFLGLNSILTNPTEYTKNSLWYQTLEQNNVLKNSTLTSEFIKEVNQQVKTFIFNNEAEFEHMSDDNIIKIITLRELTAFDSDASVFGNMLYPEHINYSELPLKTILLSYVSNSNNMFLSNSLTAADYTSLDYSWFSTLVLGLAALLIWTVTVFITILVPGIYILLGIMIIFSFFSKKKTDFSNPVKGYFKIMGIILVSFAIQTLILGQVGYLDIIGNSSSICLWVVVIADSVLVDIYIRLFIALFSDITNLGNANINAKNLAPSFMRVKLGGKSIIDRMSSKINKYKDKTNDIADMLIDEEMFNRFRRGSSVDDFDDFDTHARMANRYRKNKNNYTEDFIDADDDDEFGRFRR